jgi:hypothetical protein
MWFAFALCLLCILCQVKMILSYDCVERMKAAIEACQKNHGVPAVTADFNVGLKWEPFNLGCGQNCRFSCESLDAEPAGRVKPKWKAIPN